MKEQVRLGRGGGLGEDPLVRGDEIGGDHRRPVGPASVAPKVKGVGQAIGGKLPALSGGGERRAPAGVGGDKVFQDGADDEELVGERGPGRVEGGGFVALADAQDGFGLGRGAAGAAGQGEQGARGQTEHHLPRNGARRGNPVHGGGLHGSSHTCLYGW